MLMPLQAHWEAVTHRQHWQGLAKPTYEKTLKVDALAAVVFGLFITLQHLQE